MSMIFPIPEDVEHARNKYALVIAAAKRARQISQGAKPFVDSSSTNPLTAAFEEIAAGEVIPVQTQQEQPPLEITRHVSPATATLGIAVGTEFEQPYVEEGQEEDAESEVIKDQEESQLDTLETEILKMVTGMSDETDTPLPLEGSAEEMPFEEDLGGGLDLDPGRDLG